MCLYGRHVLLGQRLEYGNVSVRLMSLYLNLLDRMWPWKLRFQYPGIFLDQHNDKCLVFATDLCDMPVRYLIFETKVWFPDPIFVYLFKSQIISSTIHDH